MLLFAVAWASPVLERNNDLAQLVIWAHLAFDTVLALLFVPLVDPLTALVTRIMPGEIDGLEPAGVLPKNRLP